MVYALCHGFVVSAPVVQVNDNIWDMKSWLKSLCLVTIIYEGN